MIYSIHGKQTSISIDEKGMLCELSAPGIANVIAKPCGLFRLIAHDGDNWETVADGEAQETLSVSRQENRVTISCDRLKARDRVLNIAITLTVTAEDDRLIFDSEIVNRSEATVTDWVYPRVGEISELDGIDPSLLYPRHIGEKYRNICKYLKALRADSREAPHLLSDSYPGFMSMQWLMLEGTSSILYLSGRDNLFHSSFERALGSEDGTVTLEMDKLGFVRPGEAWKAPAYILQLYTGSWRRAADEYRAWASEWRHPVKPKDWARKMNGYFLVINKQQYGDEIWSYETLPRLYEYAKNWGFDTLGLFGWYHSGHDNHYPEIEVSPTMGGTEKLKENIRAVQEKGGHVTLYFQGHLLDVGTEFYKEKGHKLEGKSRWGTPYYEYYDKFCFSDYLRTFSKKPFSTVCPSCAEWHELMAEKADWVRSFGADGILYDQIGGTPPYPCYDESHHHPQNRPSLSHTQGRIALHKRIRRQVDAYQEFAYMTEHCTDVHSQFIDCIHGIGSYPGERGNDCAGPGTCNWDVPSGAIMMPELFRYTFPETMITVRNPRPVVTRRFSNYATFYGFKYEMELRYITDRKSIESDEFAQDRIYCKKVSTLRDRLRSFLLEGTFLSEEGIVNGNRMVKAAVYKDESGKKAAVFWNDQTEAQPLSFATEYGKNWNAWATAEAEGTGIPTAIPAQSVMIIWESQSAGK